MKKLKQAMLSIIAGALIASMTLGLSSCAVRVSAEELSAGVEGDYIEGKMSDSKFASSYSDFAVELLKRTVSEEENTVESPISALVVLAMIANGASGETLAQFEELFGMDVDDINEYLVNFTRALNESDEVNLENSLWINSSSGYVASDDFLKANADYYKAQIYRGSFDDKMLSDINNWAKAKTDGLIPKILDEISPDAVMYLMNAVLFDAKWNAKYEKDDLYDGSFTDIDGVTKTVTMMHSTESQYVSGDGVVGFLKKYEGGNYSLLTLLPDAGISVLDYVESLTGDKLNSLIAGATSDGVIAAMPRFSATTSEELNDALIDMGLIDAFDSSSADFSAMGNSPDGNIYIDFILQKAYIEVNENGTKAAAVTIGGTKCTSAGPNELKYVTLDRPFVYAIIDNSTGLPVFMGTVLYAD